MRILFVGGLIVSVGLNVVLLRQLSRQGVQLNLARAGLVEVEDLRQQLSELQETRANERDSKSVDRLELARLRAEASQLRRQRHEISGSRTEVSESARLRGQLTTATQALARAELELAEMTKISPDVLRQWREEAQATQCINHLKQIGLAARIWANDHQERFPPDFVSMKEELATPKVLFCPADASALRVTDWAQVNPSTISYRFLNPDGNENDPIHELFTCPLHGHTCLSDGSVQRE